LGPPLIAKALGASDRGKSMKICPTCGDEFQDRVEVCPDCEIGLKWEHEMPSLPEAITGVCIASGTQRSLRPVAAVLRADGIATRITEESAELGLGIGVEVGNVRVGIPFDGWTYCLYVLPQDAEKAQQVADDLLGVHEEHPPSFVPVEGQCPACGAAVDVGATRCSECSLFFETEDSGSGDAETFPALGLPETDALGLPLLCGGKRRR
jgi:hypothetical protein